jgi:hypothetical protein
MDVGGQMFATEAAWLPKQILISKSASCLLDLFLQQQGVYAMGVYHLFAW